MAAAPAIESSDLTETQTDKSEIKDAPATKSSWMKYLFNWQRETEKFDPVWLTIEEYQRKSEESLHEAWALLSSGGWHFEKRGPNKEDIVESIQSKKYGKVFKFTGLVDCPAKFLYDEIRDNIENMPKWNPTILESKFVKKISDGVDLSYQITAGGGKGMIQPRDFVNLRHAAKVDREGRTLARGPQSPGEGTEPYMYISSGVSVEVPGYPPSKNYVRGDNKVGCWAMRPVTSKSASGRVQQQCVFQWLMGCDLKGRIPQFVLDAALSTVMLDYIEYVRKFAAEKRNQGAF